MGCFGAPCGLFDLTFPPDVHNLHAISISTRIGPEVSGPSNSKPYVLSPHPCSALISAVLLTSCRKESDPLPSDPGGSMGSGRVLNVSGSVISSTGTQMAGAMVDCNGVSTTTDSRGVFRLHDVPVNDGPNFVRVRQSGYFNGGRIFQGFTEEDVSVKVKLLPKVQIWQFPGQHRRRCEQCGWGRRLDTGQWYCKWLSGNGARIRSIHGSEHIGRDIPDTRHGCTQRHR